MKPRVRLGHETPIAFAAEIQRPPACLGHAGDVIGAAGALMGFLTTGRAAGISRPTVYRLLKEGHPDKE